MILYASIDGVSNIISVSITETHGSSSSIATITCVSHTLSLGDGVIIDLGYEDNHAQIFKGYVKSISHDVPSNTYSLTCYDEMIRATDYFIVSDNPASPFTRSNISAEDLLEDVFTLAGSWSFSIPASSYYTFVNPEVKLISIYDFAKQVATLLAWDVWADREGVIHFANRKPYPMDGGSGQPGDIADVPISKTVDRRNEDMLSFSLTTHERNLRNKVVVWGASGIYASSYDSSPYLPEGFYKTAFLSTIIIDSQNSAEATASYNLALLNHADEIIIVNMIGDPAYEARKVVEVYESDTQTDNDYYIYSCEHAWSRNGYTTQLDLRRRV